MVKYCWRLHLAEIVITLLSGCWRFFREQTNIIWPVCNLFEGFWSNFCSHALVASLWEEVRGFCVADSPHLIWSPTPREHFSRRQPLAFAFTHSLFHWITESDIPHCQHWLDLLPCVNVSSGYLGLEVYLLLPEAFSAFKIMHWDTLWGGRIWWSF